MMSLRPPAFAGSFYPEDETELKKQIEKFLKDAKPTDIRGNVKGLIVPHAGYPYSGPIAGSGYKAIKGKDNKDVIIIGTSHKIMFQGLALTTFQSWRTPLGLVSLSPTSKDLQSDSNFNVLNEAHAFEHSIEVQLPFLQSVLKDFRITPVVTGRVSEHKEIAEILSKHLNEESLIVVSADLSHYLPYKNAIKTDQATVDKITSLDTDIKHEESCGADGIIVLIELAKLLKWKAQLLDYRNSGDTSGDKSKVVGYASIIFYK